MSGVSAEVRERRLTLAGMFNLRDVGGYPTRDGGAVRWRHVLRGDAPHRLTDGCRATLSGVGLRTVVDLRTPAERERAPGNWGPLPVEVVHRPVLTEVEVGGTLEELYAHMVDRCGPGLTAAVVEVARAEGPVLVHCSAGKDRTGLVVALVLSVLGVADRDVLADYALTSRYLNPGTPVAVRQLRGPDADVTARPDLLACPPALLASALTRLRREHGSVSSFLLAHGALPGDLARLRDRLVEPLPASTATAAPVPVVPVVPVGPVVPVARGTSSS